jgi:DNA-binding NarL/FixJ family response regulator
MKPVTLLLAEDHVIVREGLRALLEKEPDFQVVAEAEDGRKAVELAVKLAPDIVILDIAMPLLNGIETTRQILKKTQGTKVLILSAHSDDNYVERVIELGASGYLIKQSACQVLATAIREVAKGNAYFSAIIAQRRSQLAKKTALHGAKNVSNPKHKDLTSRETEVLQLIAEGRANKQTADELGISIKTVEKHRQNLMDKLNIHDTAGLTRHAIATGIIESSVQDTTLVQSESVRRSGKT